MEMTRASQSPSIYMQWIDNIQLYNRAMAATATSIPGEWISECRECTATRRHDVDLVMCWSLRLRDYTSWQSLSARRSTCPESASSSSASNSYVGDESVLTCSPRPRHRHQRPWCSRRLRNLQVCGIQPTLAQSPPKCQRDLRHMTLRCQYLHSRSSIRKVLFPVLFSYLETRTKVKVWTNVRWRTICCKIIIFKRIMYHIYNDQQ